MPRGSSISNTSSRSQLIGAAIPANNAISEYAPGNRGALITLTNAGPRHPLAFEISGSMPASCRFSNGVLDSCVGLSDYPCPQ